LAGADTVGFAGADAAGFAGADAAGFAGADAAGLVGAAFAADGVAVCGEALPLVAGVEDVGFDGAGDCGGAVVAGVACGDSGGFRAHPSTPITSSKMMKTARIS
jgi:hypothetical protein